MRRKTDIPKNPLWINNKNYYITIQKIFFKR